MIKKFHPSCRF